MLPKVLRGDSIIASRPSILWVRRRGRWVYTFFLILRDGKLGGGRYLIRIRDITVKNSIKYFSINGKIKNISYGYISISSGPHQDFDSLL